MNLRIVAAAFAALTLTVIGCASGRDLPVAEPQIRIAQTRAPGFVQERGGLLSIEYVIEVTNLADIPIRARRIELQSVGDGPYAIRPTPIEIDRVIGPRETELIPVSAWAYSYGGRTASIEPVTIRATVRFDSAEGVFHVTEVARVQQN